MGLVGKKHSCKKEKKSYLIQYDAIYYSVYKNKSFKCLEYTNIYQYRKTSKYEDWDTEARIGVLFWTKPAKIPEGC